MDPSHKDVNSLSLCYQTHAASHFSIVSKVHFSDIMFHRKT